MQINQHKIQGVIKCTKKICGFCDIIHLAIAQQHFQCRTTVSSKYVIYSLRCTECNKSYILTLEK